MRDRAKVTSVEAIESFRTSLIIYLNKARPALEEVNADVLRVKVWLQNDRRVYWQAQIRKRTIKLEEAQQTLYSARLSNLREETAAELLAVRKARQALEEAQAKLKRVKQWNQNFDSKLEPLAKHLDRLHTIFANGLPQAIAHLSETVKTLSEYARAPVQPLPATPAAPADTQAANSGVDQAGQTAAVSALSEGRTFAKGEAT
jgi:hypothetical protein